jgi:hypothetical protein
MDMLRLPLRSLETSKYAHSSTHKDLSEAAKGFLAWQRSVLGVVAPLLCLSSILAIYVFAAEYGNKRKWFSDYFGSETWAQLEPAMATLDGLYYGDMAVNLVSLVADAACVFFTILALCAWASLPRLSRLATTALACLIVPPFLLQLCFPLALAVDLDEVQHALCVHIFERSLSLAHSHSPLPFTGAARFMCRHLREIAQQRPQRGQRQRRDGPGHIELVHLRRVHRGVGAAVQQRQRQRDDPRRFPRRAGLDGQRLRLVRDVDHRHVATAAGGRASSRHASNWRDASGGWLASWRRACGGRSSPACGGGVRARPPDDASCPVCA